MNSFKFFNHLGNFIFNQYMAYPHVTLYHPQLILFWGNYREARQILCLIFVERIITAKVIERIMKKITYLSHLAVSYLTGTNTSVDALTPKVQKETLQSFRCGKVCIFFYLLCTARSFAILVLLINDLYIWCQVNLLFATDVVEEGIHVPNCSSVIRFDLPKTVRSYVQSRGRARQNDSQYTIMLER